METGSTDEGGVGALIPAESGGTRITSCYNTDKLTKQNMGRIIGDVRLLQLVPKEIVFPFLCGDIEFEVAAQDTSYSVKAFWGSTKGWE